MFDQLQPVRTTQHPLLHISHCFVFNDFLLYPSFPKSPALCHSEQLILLPSSQRMQKTHWVGTVPINLSNIKNSWFLGFLISGVVNLPATFFEMTFKCLIPGHVTTVTGIKSCSDFTAPHTSPFLPGQTPQNTDLTSCSFSLAFELLPGSPSFPVQCQSPGPPQYQTLGIVRAVLTCLTAAADTVGFIIDVLS